MKDYKTFIEFTEAFPTNDDCMRYLCDLKWGNGYQCFRCCNKEYVKGRTWYYRRCRNCGYDESCTAQTLFHKIKFPLIKAFWIVYQLGTMKKGLSTMEISRQYKIHQETAWFFKRKVQQAMHQLGRELSNKQMNISEVFSLRSETSRVFAEGKQNAFRNSSAGKRKRTSASIAKVIDVSWPFDARKGTDDKNFLYFSSNPLRIVHPEIHAFNLKNWLSGIHHRVSANHLRFYIDEYYYRFIRRKCIRKAVPKLFETMIILPWMPYTMLTCELNR